MDRRLNGGDPLERLRQWRNRGPKDLSLRPIAQQMRQRLERSHKQLAGVTGAWESLVPAALAEHCRLEGLTRGVLKVAVDSSSKLYELDLLLRQGLQKELTVQCKKVNIRRVQLRVAPLG